jgi:leucyl-tRNA synthetase
MVLKDGSKMSKSKGNTVDPQQLVEQYGADTVRMFIMFTAPPEQSLEWSDAGVEGAYRFLKRLWSIAQQHVGRGNVELDSNYHKQNFTQAQKDLRHKLHSTLHKVTDDLERRFTFNTAIASNMELLNALNVFTGTTQQDQQVRQEVLNTVMLMLAPIVPHITHTLWLELGNKTAIIEQPWPKVDHDALAKDNVTMVVQVNGKLRASIDVALDATKPEIELLAQQNENVLKFIAGKDIKKIIIVPHKLINIVVGE